LALFWRTRGDRAGGADVRADAGDSFEGVRGQSRRHWWRRALKPVVEMTAAGSFPFAGLLALAGADVCGDVTA
jgi:hypothetical protein